MTDFFFFFPWYYFLLTSQETNPGTAGRSWAVWCSHPGAAEQQRWSLGWSRCWHCSATSWVGKSSSLRATGWQSKRFICQLWDKDQGNFLYYCPWHFPEHWERFFLLLKTLHLCFPNCLCTSFPKCFTTFFSCLCLNFLQRGTNTKHSSGRKHCKTLPFLCSAKSCAKAFFMTSAHLGMALIKTNSQMMLPNDFFSRGGSTEKDNRYTLQHCSQGSLCKQGEKLIGSLLGRDKFAKIQKH